MLSLEPKIDNPKMQRSRRTIDIQPQIVRPTITLAWDTKEEVKRVRSNVDNTFNKRIRDSIVLNIGTFIEMEK
jgi:hypothetical protein